MGSLIQEAEMPREDSVVICSPQTEKNSEDSHEDEDNDDEVFNNTKISYTTQLNFYAIKRLRKF